MKLSRWQQLQYTVLFVGIALTARNAHALTFAPLVNYPAPSQLSGMAAGDLDGDGNLDFVSANGASNSFTVFMGQGDGTFRSVTTYSLSSTPLYVALGDFNGDHKLDLAITCYGSNDVKVLLGNGDGTFGAATSLSAGNNPRGIMVGDFNHDNQLDLAITNIMDNTVEVFLGNGDGTFQTGQVTAVGATQPGALAAADLNGDGKLDLVTSNYFGANCSVLLGNGDGTFAPAVTYAADSNPSSIAVQDLNNDGVPDIVVSNHAGNVSVLLGNGDGTFKPQVKYAVGANPLRVVFDDFNHDGTLDMAVALYDDAKVALLYGNGDGTFGTPIKFSVGAGSGELFVADLNHDGLDDLIIGQQNVPAVGVLLQTLNVTGLSFTPNAIIAPPTQLVATLSSNLNPASVTTSTVRLVRAGPDGVLGTADDVAITCNGVSVNGNQVTLDLTGVTLPNDKYRFMLQSSSGVAGVNGARLDGKFSGAFPSGDGTYADFNADFTLQVPTIWVTNMSPAPGATLTSIPTTLTVTTNIAPDPATVNINTVKLIRAGPDGVIGTGDDVPITPAGVSANGTQITIDLTGVKLPDDKYQVTLRSGYAASGAGLLAYYTFDEGAGAASTDVSGNGNTATLAGSAGWTAGYSGSGLSLDGSSAYASYGGGTGLNFTANQAFTFAGWVRTTDNYGAIVSQRHSTDGQADIDINVGYDGVVDNAGHLLALVRQDHGNLWARVSGGVINDGKWHHFALTRASNGQIELFLDGQSQGTDATADSVGAITTDIRTIGVEREWVLTGSGAQGQPDKQYLAGAIDDVRIYGRLLPLSEIQKLAGINSGISSSDVPLDGKFTGAFPSGDGTFANFNASFTLTTPKLTVTGITPAPGAALNAPPTPIVATFSKPVDPASATASAFRLVRAGADGQLGTADDVAITPHAVTVAGDGLSATMDLTGVKVPDDTYQVTLASGQAAPALGLTAYYKFDEGSGSTAGDSSGNHYDGTLINSPQWTTGKVAGALQFNGSNTFVNVPNSPDMGGGSLTVAAWIYMDGGSQEKFVSKWDDNAANYQFDTQVYTDRKPWFQVQQSNNTGIVAQGSTVIQYGQWYHYAGVADAATHTMTIYINGVPETLQYNPGWDGTIIHKNMQMNIGRKATGDGYWQGRIDDVRIYNRALSQTEVSALMSQGIADLNGNPLDGKFTGTFPSGDGTFANFNATFTLTTPKLTLTSLTPAPSAALNAPPTSIVATFSKPVDPVSVNASTVQLVRAGPDGQFGTADDVLITPHALTVANDGLSATVDSTGTKLRDDQYQLTLKSLEAGPSAGLIGRWTFNEGAGTVAHDSSGNGNDGTLSSPSWTAGVYGTGLNFNGVNDIVTVNQAASLEPLNGLTVAAWANIANSCAAKICELVRKDGPFQYGYILRWSDNNNSGLVELIITRNGIPTIHCTDTQGNAAYLNTWHHFAGSYDAASGTAKLYVDGVLKNTVTGTAGPLQHTDNLYFMNYPYTGSSATPGKLDEVRIYNRALNSTEVQQLAATTQGVVDANGNPLDGKFTGTFPSGDGTFADFNAGFTISTPKLTVTGMTPAPNSLIVGAPASITAIFSKPLDPSSVNTNTVKIVRAGSDGLFGTADDVAVTPNSITAATDGLSATADLTGLNLPGDRYQLRISSGNGPVNSGLTAWWKLDETSGTSVSDSSGLNQTGLWHGSSLAWTAGRVGGALQFISGDSYVEAPDNAAAIGTSDFSVAFWVNFTDGNLVHLISNRKSTVHANFWEITANGGSGIFEVDQDTVGTNYNRTATTVPLNNGVWHHFAAVRQGPQCWVYVDGVLNATATGPGIANITNASPIELGNTPYIGLNGSQTFHGKLDEVRIFSRALSASEIQQLAGVPGVTDSNGNPLDGKFTGTFPSGDGTFADFIASFRIDTAPVANAQALSVHSNAALPLTLTATDADNDPLTFTLTSSPAHGQLVGTPPNLTYLPGAFVGADNFSFKVNDGIADSNIATVVLNVADAAPVALAGAAIVHSGASTPVVLSAVDADGDPLTYSLVSLPAHGTLTGTLPNLMYTAGAFTGTDSFSFKVNDGVLDSNVATFTITVANNPPTVTAAASPTALLEFQQVSFTSTSSDPDGDALTVSWDFGDGATSSDANPVHAYTAAGTYTATVTVTDVGGLTAQATVVINVYQQADLPVARFVTSDLTGFVGQPVGFDATFSTDPDNNLIAYDWDFGDGSRHGAGQLISRVYTAPGTYTVTLTVINGFGLSDTTSLTVVVLPASEAGLFPSTLSYSVSWNRATRNADRMKLDALVNVGELPVTSATPLTLGIVGQSFSGTTGTNGPSRSGPTVQWKVKPGKKGSPKGTLQISATISHISVGAAFAKAGAVGATLKTLHLPVMLSVGGESFQASISSQFRFGNNGMRATGGGSGPK